jgi:hypothetical protein
MMDLNLLRLVPILAKEKTSRGPRAKPILRNRHSAMRSIACASSLMMRCLSVPAMVWNRPLMRRR